MFEKKFKVKHYRSRIYNPIKGKIIKAVLAVVAVCALFAAGWFAYEPLMKAINERNKEIIQNDPISKPQPEQKPAELPKEFLDKKTVAVTVPEEKLYNSGDFYSFLSSLDKEITAVVIDMKTAAGTVTYKSNQVSVQNAGATAENAVDLGSYIDTIRRAGYDVIVRIYAFEDATAPYKSSDMAIRYESEDGVLWLDDSVDNGGKPWLNPYSDTAQKYVLDIIYDAVDFGADAIILDGLRFPEESAAMGYAYFGVGTDDISREEALGMFAKRAYSATVTSETDLLIAFDGEKAALYGDVPAYGADGFAPYIDLTLFAGKKAVNGTEFGELPADTTEFVKAVYASLNLAPEAKAISVISCNGLTAGQLRSAARAIGDLETAGFVVIYDEAMFTGVVPPEEQPEDENSSQASSQPQTPPVTPVTPPASSSSTASVPESQPETPSSKPQESSSSESSSYSSIGDGTVTWG